MTEGLSMRTINSLNEMFGQIAGSICPDDDRSHKVEGIIDFWFHGSELPVSVDELRKAIRDADEQSPWKDEAPHRHDLASIHHLSDGQGGVVDVGIGYGKEEYNVSFRLNPEFQMLRRGQVQAYKKYLENLGRILNRKGFPGLKRITVYLTVIQQTTFRPEVE